MRLALVGIGLYSLLTTKVASADPAFDKRACVDAHAKAQELRNGKQLVASKQQLLVCAREDCPALVRQACSDLLGAVTQETPSIAVSVALPGGEAVTDATISVDGVPWLVLGSARDLDPGLHEVRVVHPTHGELRRTITVLEGKKSQEVSLVLGVAQLPSAPPAPAAPPAAAERSLLPPPGAFVLFGLSLASLGVGTALGVVSLGQEDEAFAAEADGTLTQEQLDDLELSRLGADIGLFGGGALLLGGAIYWIVDATSGAPSSTSASAAPRARPLVRADRAGVWLGVAGQL